MSHPAALAIWSILFLSVSIYSALRPADVVSARYALLQQEPGTPEVLRVMRIFAAIATAMVVAFGYVTGHPFVGIAVAALHAAIVLLGEIARWRHWPPYVALRTLGAVVVVVAMAWPHLDDMAFRAFAALFGLLMLLSPATWVRGPVQRTRRHEVIVMRMAAILCTVMLAPCAMLFTMKACL